MEKYVINESKRDDLLLQYMELLNRNGINVNIGQVKSKLLNKFVVEGNIHNLSLRSNFYLAGVAKYYFDGSLTKNKDLSLLKRETWEGQNIQDTWDVNICSKLDTLILVLRNAYIDTVGTEMLEPEDFGELPIKELFRKYSKQISKERGTTRNKANGSVLDTNENVGNGYTFEIMYSFADCQKYNMATSPGAWCITYGQQHYNYYAKELGIHYVIFRKNGWENVPRPKNPLEEEGFTPQKPHDAYGNSLIALLQSNTSPEPKYITSRWNHGNEVRCEADHAYTKDEFEQITGVSDADLKRIYDIWKANHNSANRNSVNRKEEMFTRRSLKYLQMRINGGENPEKLFTSMSHIYGSTKINKGTFACYATISDTTMGRDSKVVYFLFDSGKIVFDSVCTNNSAFKRVKDKQIILISFGENKNSIYSLDKHKFVSVDGVIKFKRVPNLDSLTWTNNIGFFEVKQGKSDGALIDASTMEALRLPNGEYWYNLVQSNMKNNWHKDNEIYCSLFGNEPGQLLMFVYDMSSLETYYYTCKDKKFIHIPVPNEISLKWECGNMESNRGFMPFPEDLAYSNIKSMDEYVYPIRYGIPSSYGLERNRLYYRNESYLQLIKNGNPVMIDNTTWFNSIDGSRQFDNIYCVYIPTKKDSKFARPTYSVLIDKTFEHGFSIDGNDLLRFEKHDYSTGLYTMYIDYNYGKSIFVLYNPKNNTILINPLDNTYYFKGTTNYFYNKVDGGILNGEGYILLSKNEIPKEFENYGMLYRDINEDGYNILKITTRKLLEICNTENAKWVPVSNIKTEGEKENSGDKRINESDLYSMVRKSVKIIMEQLNK